MPGLRFHKLDLHAHSPASKCYSRPEHTPDLIIQAAIARGLAALAITDHNTATWIDAMRQAAQGTSLVVFPGVEISVSEGFHVVALFDPSADQKHVEGFLGAIHIKPEEHGKQEAICTKNAHEVIKEIREWRGLAVLAHIDRPKGAFQELAKPKGDGKINVPVTCSKLFNEAEYDAVECADGRLPEGFDGAHQIRRFPTFYQASDNPDPTKPTRHAADGLGTIYSWFKLDRIDLEGLRQCFADPEVRIRLMGEKEDVGYPRVVSLHIGGAGFLRNQSLEFEGGLNSVIGGKGVGKSLAVEFLRFGLAQPSSDPNLASDLLGKLDKRLEVGNTVDVVYQLADGTPYRIAQTYTGRERGRDGRPTSTHKCTNLRTGAEYAGDIAEMFPILAYSQTEVIKIAESQTAQLELIDRFIDTRQHERDIADAEAKLEDSDERLSKAIQARDRLKSCDLQISTLKEKIEAINKSLADPLFDAWQAAESKKKAFEARRNYVLGLAAEVRKWQSKTTSLNVEALTDSLAQDEELRGVQATAEGAHTRVLESIKDLLTDLATDDQAIEAGLNAWMPTFTKVKEEYDTLLATIGGDRSSKEAERKRLQDQKDELDAEANGYQELSQSLPELLRTRNQYLDELERAHRRFYEVRKAKFDQLTALSDGKLQLVLDHAVDRRTYEAKLNDLLKGGTNAPTVADRNKIAQNVAPRRLVGLVLDRDVPRLADEAGISELWAERAIEKLWSCADFTEVLALQHNCYPTDIPTIKFQKEGNQYDPLNELSVGQKCTALLIIALCDGTMPIVIDQPEDALDVISVWEDIAKKLRRGKNSRQFILTTHDSTVAVSADSDQFIVLRAGATSGKVVFAGAIDREDVREAVIKHLEGGQEPYMLRSRKYNIKGNVA